LTIERVVVRMFENRTHARGAMANKKYLPTSTKDDFDGLSSSLCADLKHKYDEAKDDNAKPPVKASLMGAFDHLPDLDSKTVAKWSATIKKHMGCELDPSLIRRGGYRSFDDFWGEMWKKLRGTCPDAVQAETTGTEIHT
jgi:hypothetical protein